MAITSRREEYALDRTHQAKLVKLARARGVSPSALLTELIDQAAHEREATERAARHEAIEWFRTANLEDLPDPETLSQQIDGTLPLPDLSRR